MKKYILTIAVFTLCSFSFGQLTKAEKKQAKIERRQLKKDAKAHEKYMANFKGDPENPITFTKKLIENNDLAYGSEFLFSFEFTNTGVDSLEITNIKTSCGCTQAAKPEKMLAPGESSVIAVSYDTKRVGPFVKDIYVTTNNTAPITLSIKGIVASKPN